MEKKPSQITVSMPKELLEFIERRSGELGIGRAQLIVQYIRSDMNNEGKPLVVIPTHKERGLWGLCIPFSPFAAALGGPPLTVKAL